ncbi:MAG: guanylate kinase [Oscillatoriales cyanobacterium RM1_1_9]|nr:guanylate kinase [Oscillatoriales cyanobacterium SM2_3_0]NJO47067.1 guanylate kinase [Oscillatoriales cyanobacterium RM2_1_1]NJO70688.1 guanylate kinase [Oscillatoriales cyanobacterium RM1_1_9]
MAAQPSSTTPQTALPVDSPTGRLVVITGPSGVGKGTLVRSLRQRHPELHLSVSVTTRAPRADEVEGQDYYFVDHPRFQQMVENGELLEWAEFAGNCYGTPWRPVQQRVEAGESVLLEIELAGARQVQQLFPQAQRVFIHPPSMAELERRLRERGQDSEAAISRRLQRAQDEIAAASEFDFEVTNDNLDAALAALENVLFLQA